MKLLKKNLLICFALLLSLTAMTGCQTGSANNNTQGSDDTVTSSSTGTGTTTGTTTGTSATTGNTKTVGQEPHGYIDIPQSWVDFHDIDPMPGAIQFTNGDGAIITMNVFDSDTDPQVALTNLWGYFESDGAVDLTGATVMLNGETSYQLYGYYPELDSYVVVWMFRGSDDVVRYICAEGPTEYIGETVAIVENTFRY